MHVCFPSIAATQGDMFLFLFTPLASFWVKPIVTSCVDAVCSNIANAQFKSRKDNVFFLFQIR